MRNLKIVILILVLGLGINNSKAQQRTKPVFTNVKIANVDNQPGYITLSFDVTNAQFEKEWRLQIARGIDSTKFNTFIAVSPDSLNVNKHYDLMVKLPKKQ